MTNLPDYNTLGYSKWKPGQKQAVESFWQEKDTVVVMPTGGGKSACYQIPAIAGEGLTVVFSPLQALMLDQVKKINSLVEGNPAACWIGGLDADQVSEIKASVRSHQLKILYVSPERLNYEAFHNLLKEIFVSRVVVDEAHCVSKWGTRFRPEFLKISDWINTLSKRPTVMAATASASKRVLKDIVAKLDMQNQVEIHMGFNRPNISIDKIPLYGEGVGQRLQMLLSQSLSKKEFLPAIVYAGTKKEVMELSERLIFEGINAVPYHAGIDAATKAKNALGFIEGKINVLVATNAFGMGIDISGIRSVWHTKWPTSFEDWYQEFGRAGRDEMPAKAILCAPKHDIMRVERMLSNPDDGQEDIEKIKQQVGQLWDLFAEEGCLRQLVLDHFDDPSEPKFDTRCCSNCSPPDWVDNMKTILTPKKPVKKTVKKAGTKTKDHAPVFFFNNKGQAQINGIEESVGEGIDQLRAWRKSRALGKPAYTVCNDKALLAIMQQKPTNDDELLAMPGIGPAFIEKHSESLFGLLKNL